MDGTSILQFVSETLLLAQANSPPAGGGPSTSDEHWNPYLIGAIFVLGIFVIPFILSRFITTAVRMPSHSFRLGVMLAAIFGGLLFAWGNNFRLELGPDMKGGTQLVWDIKADGSGQTIDASALASALNDRINPSGTKEIIIRPLGSSQIQIIVPATGELELRRIKDLISSSGQLEFRIVANTRDHQKVIELAEQQESASAEVDVVKDDHVVGRWFTVARAEDKQDGIFPLKTPVLGDTIRDTYTGQIITNPPLNIDDNHALEHWMDREGIRDVDVLMSLESSSETPYAEVSGDDLSSAATEFDKTGYVVSFRLNTVGASKMAHLTSANQPTGPFHRRMAIIMDDKVLSAPQLNSTISSNGQITGNFTREEVEYLVTMLRSGRLPATLEEEPASENRVGAGLGANTIEKGKIASLWAVGVTFLCIIFYYWFAGLVAAMALIINGLLIFGVMIFIGQPLTLPGLAGLVLTIGMSVDANVLIFERIREETTKGSAPRMAIRNGFDRAFTTIIDSNLTTLIAAIVLYWIGTDQVRGFAVALIIGIVTSLFTATFCSRIVFEIAEKLKVVNLSMVDGVGFLKRTFLGTGDINFMGWQKTCLVFSTVIIAVGIAAVTMRGKDLLNIDFTGGTSVTMQFLEPIDADDLRVLTKKILVKDQQNQPVQSTLTSVEMGLSNTVYTLITSIDDEKFLAEQLVNGFAKENSVNLKTYKIDVRSMTPADTGFLQNDRSRIRLVAYQDSAATDGDDGASSTTGDATTGDATAGDATTGDATAGDAVNAESSEAVAVDGDDATTGDSEAEVNDDEDLATAIPTRESSELILEVGGSTDGDSGSGEETRIDGTTLKNKLIDAAKNAGLTVNKAALQVFPEPQPEDWRPGAIEGHSEWKVLFPVSEADATTIVSQLQSDMAKEPLWISLSKIGTRVAGEMKQRAVAAILVSLVFIVAYIWFRFQKAAYGLAAVVALVHDVLITLGVLALCHWLAGPLNFLLIEDFKIGLTEVAAFLTIIGYSLNDTIVVFDRIREVRGRSPRLTADMVNASVNQTLSRTLLTSGTTLLTVLILFIFGGEGIHTFAFALLVGVTVGTYSSIFVAAPVLLWFSNRQAAKNQHRPGFVG